MMAPSVFFCIICCTMLQLMNRRGGLDSSDDTTLP